MKNLIIYKYNYVNKEIVQTATEIFREINNSRLNKKINFNFFKKNQFFVILKKNENLIGIIRVIKKKLYLGKKKLNVACLTSIGIKKKFRNKGYAKILIKSSLKLLKKDFDAALLIARRKVDHFYDKFGFRGNSNFCEIKFETHSKKLFKSDSKIDFNITKKNMYSSTHKKNNGYIYRNQEDWDLIKLKIKKNFFKLATIFNSKKKEIGYIIFKNKTIFEYGFNNKYLKEFLNSTNFFFSGFVVIKNPTKSVLKYYIKYKEVTVSKRFCNFGGHMIYFFKKKNLSKIRYNINYFDEF